LATSWVEIKFKLNGYKLNSLRKLKPAAKLPFWNFLTEAQTGNGYQQRGRTVTGVARKTRTHAERFLDGKSPAGGIVLVWNDSHFWDLNPDR
jgi:hypothetical protein